MTAVGSQSSLDLTQHDVLVVAASVQRLRCADWMPVERMHAQLDLLAFVLTILYIDGFLFSVQFEVLDVHFFDVHMYLSHERLQSEPGRFELTCTFMRSQCIRAMRPQEHRSCREHVVTLHARCKSSGNTSGQAATSSPGIYAGAHTGSEISCMESTRCDLIACFVQRHHAIQSCID